MSKLKWENPKGEPGGKMYDNLMNVLDTAQDAIKQLNQTRSELQKKYDEELEKQERENGSKMETTETR